MLQRTNSSAYVTPASASDRVRKSVSAASRSDLAGQSKVATPRTLPASPCAENKGAADCSAHGLLAYACQALVVVFDLATMAVVQTLDGHLHPVTKIRWAAESKFNQPTARNLQLLASADNSGRLLIWNSLEHKPIFALRGQNRPVLDLCWKPNDPIVLAVVHAPSVLTLWNTSTGSKIWSADFKYELRSFAFDPFEPANGVLQAANGFVFSIQGFNAPMKSEVVISLLHFGDQYPSTINELPTLDGFAFTMRNVGALPSFKSRKVNTVPGPSPLRPSASSSSSSVSPAANTSSTASTASSSSTNVSASAIAVATAKLKSANKNSDRDEKPASSDSQILGIVWSQSEKDICIVVKSSELIFWDTGINQIVDLIPNERGTSPFLKIALSKVYPEFIFCHHENGSVSILKRGNSQPRFSFEPLRPTRGAKLLSIAFVPGDEGNIAAVGSDGRILHYVYEDAVICKQQREILHIPAPLTAKQVDLDHSAAPRVTLTGYLETICNPVQCIAVSHFKRAPNFNQCALGSVDGRIQIVELKTLAVIRDISVINAPIRNIKWLDMYRLISYGYEESAKDTFKNHIRITYLQTGLSEEIPCDHRRNTSIKSISVSNQRNYVIALYNNGLFDLWDLNRKALSHHVPTTPNVVQLEWSTLQYSRKSATPEEQKGTAAREHFLMTSTDGQMTHCTVQNNAVSEQSKFPQDSSAYTILCMSWKDEVLVTGDSGGILHVYDFKTRTSRMVPTGHGAIKRIRFNPVRSENTVLVLGSDALGLWELISETQNGKEDDMITCIAWVGKSAANAVDKSNHVLSSTTGAGAGRVLDVDWMTSSNPVLVCADGCMRISDKTLRRFHSPASVYDYKTNITNPVMLSERALGSLQVIMSHQPWRKQQEDSNADGYRLFEGCSFESEFQDQRIAGKVEQQISNIPTATLHALSDGDMEKIKPDGLPNPTTAYRCLLTSQYLSDRAAIDFWNTAIYYFEYFRNGMHQKGANLAPPQSLRSLVRKSLGTQPNQGQHHQHEHDQESKALPINSAWKLLPHHDVLGDHASFRGAMQQRVAAQRDAVNANIGMCDSVYEAGKQVVRSCIILNNVESSTSILLNTSPSHASFSADIYKACLIAAMQDPQHLDETIQLAASNLIINNDLLGGVELLCLAGRWIEACNYLQSFGKWTLAATVAKGSLSFEEMSYILGKWADSNLASHETEKALHIYLSIGEFDQVLNVLHSQRLHWFAQLFLESAREYGFLLADGSGATVSESVHRKRPQRVQQDNAALYRDVNLSYSRYLMQLGFHADVLAHFDKGHHSDDEEDLDDNDDDQDQDQDDKDGDSNKKGSNEDKKDSKFKVRTKSNSSILKGASHSTTILASVDEDNEPDTISANATPTATETESDASSSSTTKG